MLSVARVTMNGCGSRPQTKTVPLTAPTSSAGARASRRTTSGPEGTASKTSAPDHGRQGERRADRQVDAPGDDDQQLGQREHRDDRRLAEHVAEVAGA